MDFSAIWTLRRCRCDKYLLLLGQCSQQERKNCQASNKLHITKDIKDCRNRKRAAFGERHMARLLLIQKEKLLLKQAKRAYSSRTCFKKPNENHCQHASKQGTVSDDGLTKANELNDFYLRFHTLDFSLS